MKNELNHILQMIEVIKERYDSIRDQEEKFNIFSVLYKEQDERKLHSRFIAALLDPFASHGLGYCFLNNFIDLFPGIEKKNYQNSIVHPEEWNKKENNNIDILIIDRKSKNAIIIENKIYAGDSNNKSGGQLERYFKYVKDNEKIPECNIYVFYLTLDGHQPSIESIGEFKCLEHINGKCISYDTHIIEWLNTNIKEVSDRPFLRESILQYKKLINKMTQNEINAEERIKMKELIAQSTNTMSATKYLIDNFKHVKWQTIFDFWEELKIEIEQKGFSIIAPVDQESITFLTHHDINKSEEEGGLIFKISEGLECFIWHEKNDWLFWGFEKKKENEIYLKQLQELCKEKILQQNDAYFWKYFEFTDGENLWLKNFSNQKTFNLIDKKFRKETIEKIVNDIINFIEIELKIKI